MAGKPFLRLMRDAIEEIGGEDAIHARIADGQTIREIVDELTAVSRRLSPGRFEAIGKPNGFSRPMFYDWVKLGPKGPDGLSDRKRRYLEARKTSAVSHVDQAQHLIDRATPGDIGVVREQVRTRLWLAGKADREQFGEAPASVQINIGSLHLDALRHRNVTAVVPPPPSPPLPDADYEVLESGEEPNSAPPLPLPGSSAS